jgi:hypothetical protein
MTPFPHVNPLSPQIEQAMQRAIERRRRELWAAAIRAVQQRARRDGDDWWLI